MKLIICIVQDQDSALLIDDLTENKYRVTNLASTGGFLKSGNTTLLLGVEDEHVDDALAIIKVNSKTRELSTSLLTVTMPGDAYIPFPLQVTVGGATVFILNIEKHIKI